MGKTYNSVMVQRYSKPSLWFVELAGYPTKFKILKQYIFK